MPVSPARGATVPESPPETPPAPRYTWVVGLGALVVIAAVLINSVPNSGRGIRGLPPGTAAPQFTASAALSGRPGDANVRQAEGGTEEDGAVPACEVSDPQTVSSCSLRSAPLVLTFVTAGCEQQLDRVQAIAEEHPQINFGGVLVGMDAAESQQVARAGGWRFPLAADPDAAVFNLYRVADCPSTVFADGRGKIAATRLGPLSEAGLEAEIEMLKTDGSDGR